MVACPMPLTLTIPADLLGMGIESGVGELFLAVLPPEETHSDAPS